MLPLFRHDDPDIGAIVPGPSAIVPEHRVDPEPGPFELAGHLAHRESPERQVEAVLPGLATPLLDILLFERGQVALRILADRFNERELGAASASSQRPVLVSRYLGTSA